MLTTDLQIARDRTLAKRMRRGDERAVTEFCDAYLGRLYRYALRRVDNPADADDVVQIVLTQAARRIETYRGESTLQAWLLTICQRELYRQGVSARRHRVLVSIDADDAMAGVLNELSAPAAEEPEQGLRRLELAERVRACLDELPERYARALELKYVEGLSSREIAGRFDISDEAVQSLLARARRSFREVCDEQLHMDGNAANGEA